ncbi:MAG TPA: ABC transporter permease [Nocardioidaceae bacterium]|nr:ABC transporter permease [Nocardioidaceae bacterium]
MSPEPSPETSPETSPSVRTEAVGPSMTALVRSELLKIRSTRLWWAILIGAVLWTMLNAAIVAGTAGLEAGMGGQTSPGVDSPELLRTVYSAGFSGAYIFAMILGVTGMTGEYRYLTITPTFLVAPKRYPVVVAKLLAHVVMGLVYGVVAAIAAIAAGLPVVLLKGGDPGLLADGVPRAVLLSVVAVALWTLIGIGLGTLIKNQIAAILIGVVLAFLIEPLVNLLFSFLDSDLGKFLPTTASQALLDPYSAGFALLEWWAGGLVLIGYAVVFSLIGVLFSVRRDIT